MHVLEPGHIDEVATDNTSAPPPTGVLNLGLVVAVPVRSSPSRYLKTFPPAEARYELADMPNGVARSQHGMLR